MCNEMFTPEFHFSSKLLDLLTRGSTPRESYCSNNGEGGGGGGGTARRCARDAVASPAHTHASAPTPAPPVQPQPHIKSERLSPHDSSASRSRSVTPSTSSYPGTPPERGSPHAPQHPAPAHPSRVCSDMIRSLAARYNPLPNNDYIYRMNGFAVKRESTSPAQTDATDVPLGGLFTKLAKHQGGSPKLPAFPVIFDMSATKMLMVLSRVQPSGGRSRRSKRVRVGSLPEHSPLDLSAAGESAAKRARLSASPSTRSDSDDKDRVRNEECMCAELRARVSAWSVDEVCDFVNSIDNCAEYALNFRDQRIDGAVLPLITEDMLTGMLQMKLGPALKLKMALASRLEPCSRCQAVNIATTTVVATAAQGTTGPKINGTSVKSEPRSNTTSPS